MAGWKRRALAAALVAVIGIWMFAGGSGTPTRAWAEETAVTAEPVPEPTPKPTPEPTPEPTAQPTVEVTSEPTAEPTAEVTPEPTAEPVPSPSPESREFVLKRRSRDWADLELSDLEYLEGGMRIPALFQYDYGTVIATLGDEDITVASTGCGTTALSMAIAYLTGDLDQTPYTLLYDAIEDGLYHGHGLGHGALSRLARANGLEAEWIWASEELIREALESGHPVIAHMGDGTFTQEGHYILLRGLDDDGRVYVTDPNSRSNSRKTYSLYRIIKESRSEDPFMILSLPEEEQQTPSLSQQLSQPASPAPSLAPPPALLNPGLE